MAETHVDVPLKAPQINACPMKWEQLAGNDTTRYCQQCTLHVHNLSAMPRQEAMALLNGNKKADPAAEHLCIAYFADAEGNVITEDEPAAPTTRAHPAFRTEDPSCGAQRHAGWNLSALLAGLTATFASLLTGCVHAPPIPVHEEVYATRPPILKNSSFAPQKASAHQTASQPPSEPWTFALQPPPVKKEPYIIWKATEPTDPPPRSMVVGNLKSY